KQIYQHGSCPIEALCVNRNLFLFPATCVCDLPDARAMRDAVTRLSQRRLVTFRARAAILSWPLPLRARSDCKAESRAVCRLDNNGPETSSSRKCRGDRLELAAC